jgi:hypothetical protein
VNQLALTHWQRFWRAFDEARLMVRVMVVAKFLALVTYVFYGTQHYHQIVAGALVQTAAKQATFGELTPVLAAVTAFYSLTIPMLSKMYLEAWKDYRQSGTDWTHVEAKAALGAENMPGPAASGQS